MFSPYLSCPVPTSPAEFTTLAEGSLRWAQPQLPYGRAHCLCGRVYSRCENGIVHRASKYVIHVLRCGHKLHHMTLVQCLGVYVWVC